MVIMDREDYINKANSLLNQNTYRSISRDPTNSIKNKLISILKRVKNQTGLYSNTYKSMYPTGCVPPKFYGLPKIHKPDTPLRPIVSSCRSVTYGMAKELAKILKPLVGKSPHHINSTQDFVEQGKHITLACGECLSSYDVSALFTSVPVDPALNIIMDSLLELFLFHRTCFWLSKTSFQAHWALHQWAWKLVFDNQKHVLWKRKSSSNEGPQTWWRAQWAWKLVFDNQKHVLWKSKSSSNKYKPTEW